jgi:HSP20 family protein
MLQDFWEPTMVTPWASTAYSFVPQIDVEEDERQLKVYAELPGMTEKDVEIMFEPGALVVRGEKKEEEHLTSRRGRGRYDERRYGSFERRIPVSSEVQENKIEAKFDRGLLTITVPKSEEVRAKTKRIQIQAPSSQTESRAT